MKFFKWFFLFSFFMSESIVYSKRYMHPNQVDWRKIQEFISANNERNSPIPYSNIKNNLNLVVIVCPIMVTGGPENLCQLYAELKKIGFEVYFLWVDHVSNIQKKYENGICYLCKDEKNTINLAYLESYKVNFLARDIPLVDSTLIIVPEMWADIISLFDKAQVAIAWLSIGNLMGKYTELIRQLIKHNILKNIHCIHLSQAPWISKTLEFWGVESFLLSDYISKHYFDITNILKEENSVAVYPKKGGKLLANFMKEYSNFDYIRLENLNQAEMVQALDSAKVYVDFGHFPGRDRIPREALLRNCVIFIRDVACATDFDSFPIDNYFRFSDKDILDGTLFKKVSDTLSDYENMKKKQDFMRKQVEQEPFVFKKNVQDFFGNPKN